MHLIQGVSINLFLKVVSSILVISATESSSALSADLFSKWLESLNQHQYQKESFEGFHNPCYNTWIHALDEATVQFVSSLNMLLATEYKENYIPKVIVVEEIRHARNRSYFMTEFLLEDILFPHIFGTNKFQANCAITLVHAHTNSKILKLTNSLISNKLVRPREDYFVHMIESTETYEAVISEFSDKIRHLNFLMRSSNLKAYPGIVWFGGCNIGFKALFYSERCQLHLNGKQLTISTVSAPEKMRFKNFSNGSLFHGEGVYFEMIQAASQIHNFTFKIRIAADGGKKNKHGVWEGAAADVFQRRANFNVIFGSSPSRQTILDFSATMDRYTRVFYIPAPIMGISWRAAFRPLSPLVWLLILLTFFVVIWTAYASRTWSRRKSAGGIILEKITFTNILGTLLTVVLDQATNARTWVGFKIRWILILWFVFCLIMGTGYRSKLVSFLTKPEALLSIPKTHQELVYSDYTLFFRYYGGAAYSYVTNSKNPMHKEMLKRIQLIKSSSECITLALLTEKSACMDYSAAGDFAVSANTSLTSSQMKTMFVTSEDTDLSVGMVWGFAKGSPLIPEFDRLILNCMSSGLHDRWIYDSQIRVKIIGSQYIRSQKHSKLRDRLELIYNSGKLTEGLSLSSMYGVFILVIIGLATAFLCFYFEIVYIYFKLPQLLKIIDNYFFKVSRSIGKNVE